MPSNGALVQITAAVASAVIDAIAGSVAGHRRDDLNQRAV